MGNGNTNPRDSFVRELLGNDATSAPRRKTWGEKVAESDARKAAAVTKAIVQSAPKAEIDPYTHDTAFVVVPREVMNRLMDKAGVTKTEIEARIEEEVKNMTDLELVKYTCAKASEGAPIWPLLSFLARIGRKVEAFQQAQVQFRGEARRNKAKAACVHWADKLVVPVVMLLGSGDFQKPEEIAFDLIEQAKKENRPGFVKQMLADFTSVRLVPVASLHPVVATNAELGDRKVDVLPPEADEDTDDLPTAEKAAVVPVLSKNERIEAKAIKLAKDKGTDYKTAVSAVRSYYRNEARRLLGL